MKANRIVPHIVRSLKNKKGLILKIQKNKTMATCSRAFKWLLLVGHKLINNQLKNNILQLGILVLEQKLQERRIYNKNNTK